MRKNFVTLTLIPVVLLVFTLHPRVVFADDGTPPPSESSSGSETPPTENTEEHETEQSEVINQSGIDVPPVEGGSLDQGATIDQLESPGDTSISTVSQVLEQIPDGTQVVVLTNEGEADVLASQDAVEIVQKGDPMWCPDTALPGDSACSDSYDTFDELLVDLGSFSGDGTIYVAYNYNSALEPDDITIDGNLLPSLGSLTIQGGWDGVLGSDDILGTSLFDGISLEIINWRGKVNVNDVIFDDTLYGLEINTSGAVSLDGVEVAATTSNDGISIQAGGNVNLNDVDSSSNSERGASITTNGSIDIHNSNFSNNGSTGAVLAGNSDVIVSDSTFNINTGSAYAAGIEIDTPGSVTISNVIANYNQDDGIAVSTSPNVNLNNITVDHNGWDGAYADGQCTRVNVSGGIFTNNGFINPEGGYGLEVDNGIISQSGSPIFANNFLGDSIERLDPCFITQPPVEEPAGEDVPKSNPVFTVAGGHVISLPCGSSVITLVTPQDTHATFTNLCNYQAFIFDETPEDLGNRFPLLGSPFFRGVTITLLFENNEISTIPVTSKNIVLSFRISDEDFDKEYSVYYWDTANWIELDGVKKANERVEVLTNHTGTFVLIQK